MDPSAYIEIPLDDAVSFVDTGTWAPITEPKAGEARSAGYHNYLVVEADPSRPCVTFDCWHLGA